jgi:predicted MPP superfamily phosphohydrolase
MNTFESESMPKKFVGYSIVQVSDLDNSSKVGKIVSKTKELKPDIIVLTGGYYDKNGNCNNSVKAVTKLAKIAPTYYVTSPDDKEDCLASTGAINVSNTLARIEPEQLTAEQFIKKNYGDDIINKAKAGDKKSSEYVKYIETELSKSSDGQMALSLIGLTSDSTSEKVNVDDAQLSTEEAMQRQIDTTLEEYKETHPDATENTDSDLNALLGTDTASSDSSETESNESVDSTQSSEDEGTVIDTDENELKKATDALTKYDDSHYRIALLGDISKADLLNGAKLNLIFAGGTHGTSDVSQYSKGMYTVGNISLLVSGGIGKPDSGSRFLNLPEINYIRLSDGTIKQKNTLEKFIDKFYKGDVKTIFDNDGGFSKHTYRVNSSGEMK